jgi:hypothetical protein
MFGRRSDATLVTDAPAIRRFMPFISRRRNESLVYYAQEIRVDRALHFAEERSRSRPPGRRMTLFHLLLAACARSIHERPRMNRFVKGGRLWQRDGVWLTFSAKMRMDDDAPLITVKRPVDPTLPLEAWVDALLDSLERSRRGEQSTSDKEVGLLLRLPPSITRLLLALADKADDLGMLPRSMIDTDPMYATIFVANLGSVNLEAGYHHLWEHGTCGIFGVMGRIREEQDGTRRITVKWSYDERIEDGLYAMGTLERIRELLESPEKFA